MVNKLHISDELCLASGRAVLNSLDCDSFTVFDVGANEGLFAKTIYSQLGDFDLSLHCFEPNPIAFEKLAVAVEPIESVKTVQLALSDQVSTEIIYYPEKKTVLGSFIKREVFEEHRRKWGETIERSVQVSTIDQYVLAADVAEIHYLKIDTEGTELNVLRGAENSLKNRLVSCGQFEYGGTFLDAKLSVTDVFEFLSRYGYVIYDVEAGELVDQSYTDDFMLKNHFFCQKELVSAVFANS